MDIQTLQDILLWCLLINIGIYLLTALAISTMRSFVNRIQSRIFGLEESVVAASNLRYLASYKLFITVFNFVPWLALKIIS